jgi:hypothetical protein
MTLAGARPFPGFGGETLDTEGGGGFNTRKLLIPDLCSSIPISSSRYRMRVLIVLGHENTLATCAANSR